MGIIRDKNLAMALASKKSFDIRNTKDKEYPYVAQHKEVLHNWNQFRTYAEIVEWLELNK